MGKKLTFEQVENVFNENGYILLQQEYLGNNQKLMYKCKKHSDEIQYGRLKHAKDGKLCKFCKGEKLKKAKSIPQEMVFNEYISKGLIPEPNQKYLNARTPIAVRCIHHKDDILRITYDNLSNKNSGCRHCFYERNTSENNGNWKGGITELAKYLRNYTQFWVQESLNTYENTCVISGKTSKLEVHHLTSFSRILNDILDNLKLESKSSISDYSESELKIIKDRLIDYHKNNLGVVLYYDIHKLFHSIYGYDNVPSQFEEFKAKYSNGEYHIERGDVA